MRWLFWRFGGRRMKGAEALFEHLQKLLKESVHEAQVAPTAAGGSFKVPAHFAARRRHVTSMVVPGLCRERHAYVRFGGRF
jgi:hypothetical protein